MKSGRFAQIATVIDWDVRQRFRGHVPILDQHQVTALFSFAHIGPALQMQAVVSAQTGFRLSTHIHDQRGTGGLQSALVSKVGEHHDRLCTCHHCPEPRCGAACGQFVRSPELGARNLGCRERHLSEIDSIDMSKLTFEEVSQDLQ
jgi:hypothetical protein